MPESTPPARILIVDDDPGFLRLLTDAIQLEGYHVSAASSGTAALAWLATHTADLMLLDLKMKDIGGQGLIKRLKRDDLDVPFIVVTGQGDEKVAVEVMKQGAMDYVMKDTAMLDLLPSVVKRSLTAIERDRALVTVREEQRRLEKELLEISEREQHRIGQDLHDGLGQQLTAIEMLCTGLKEDVAGQPAVAAQVERISQFLRESISHVRLLARGLVPVGDGPDALRAGLEELVQRMNSSGRVTVTFVAPRSVAVSEGPVAGHLYRIAQEALNNAFKHGQATEVVIRLEPAEGGLELAIADNGRGLQKSSTRGLGLHAMRHRASLIGAELTVESKPGQGVTIRCRLPVAP